MVGDVLLVGAMASADNVTFTGDGNGSSWGDAENWDSDPNLPTADDRAIIPLAFSVDVDDDFTVDSIEVYGALFINPGNTLTLELDDFDTSCGAPLCSGAEQAHHHIEGP